MISRTKATLERLLSGKLFRHCPYKEAHGLMRDYANVIDSTIYGQVNDEIHGLGLGDGGGMLHESLYQMSKWYQPLRYVYAPFLPTDLDIMPWINLQRMRALVAVTADEICLLYTSPSPRDATLSRMPSSA